MRLKSRRFGANSVSLLQYLRRCIEKKEPSAKEAFRCGQMCTLFHQTIASLELGLLCHHMVMSVVREGFLVYEVEETLTSGSEKTPELG